MLFSIFLVKNVLFVNYNYYICLEEKDKRVK